MEDSIISQKEPLLIPSIILEIFNYLPTGDIKHSCRAVCKIWHEEGNRALRKRQALKVYLKNYDTLNDYFQSSPSQKEVFNDFHLGVRLQLKDPRIQRFFTQFGAFITALDLGKSQWPNTTLRKLLADNLPNLEELSLQLLTPKGSSTSSSGEPSPASLPPSDPFPENPGSRKTSTESQNLGSVPPEQNPFERRIWKETNANWKDPNANWKDPTLPFVEDPYSHYAPEDPYIAQGQGQPWSYPYPTPPPAKGDYNYQSYTASYVQGQGSAEFYPQNMSNGGEWQNNSNFNYTTTNYQSSHPNPSRGLSLNPPQGDWHYCNLSREWYWSATMPHVHTEYSSGISYQVPPSTNYYQNNAPPPPAPTFNYQNALGPPPNFNNYPPNPQPQPLPPPLPTFNLEFENRHFSNGGFVNNSPAPVPKTYYPPIIENTTGLARNDLSSAFHSYTPPASNPSPNSSETQPCVFGKLKSLKFRIDYALTWNPEQQEGVKSFFKNLITGMPNLERISCSQLPSKPLLAADKDSQTSRDHGVEPNLLPILEVLSDPHGPPLKSLKHLDIPLKNWSKTHRFGRRYPLEQMSWSIHRNLHFKTFQHSLIKLRRTLTKLEINFQSTDADFLASFQVEMEESTCLENIKHLSLTSFNGSVGFILKLPRIQTLTIDHVKPDFELLFSDNHFKKKMSAATSANQSLHTLTIQNCNYLGVGESGIDGKTLRKISRGFPCLKNLHLEFVGDDGMETIFKNIKQLESLRISQGLFTDSCFIGLKPKSMDAFLRRQNGKSIRTRAKESNQPNNRDSPFIGNLTNLKKLDICSKYLTDLSVFYGILECKNLTSLTVQAYGLTDASLKKLADESNLVYLKTIACNQLTIGGVNYIREKLPSCHLSLNEYQGPMSEAEAKRLCLIGTGYKVMLERDLETKFLTAVQNQK